MRKKKSSKNYDSIKKVQDLNETMDTTMSDDSDINPVNNNSPVSDKQKKMDLHHKQNQTRRDHDGYGSLARLDQHITVCRTKTKLKSGENNDDNDSRGRTLEQQQQQQGGGSQRSKSFSLTRRTKKSTKRKGKRNESKNGNNSFSGSRQQYSQDDMSASCASGSTKSSFFLRKIGSLIPNSRKVEETDDKSISSKRSFFSTTSSKCKSIASRGSYRFRHFRHNKHTKSKKEQPHENEPDISKNIVITAVTKDYPPPKKDNFVIKSRKVRSEYYRFVFEY